MTEEIHNPRCFANHMGLWAADADWLTSTVSAIKAGIMKPIEGAIPSKAAGDRDFLFQDGLAIIPIRGAMIKGGSKYGGANTQAIRHAVIRANAASDVRRILLHIESPGGRVSGVQALADSVFYSKKPIHAHIEDLGASAAVWVASQVGPGRLTADTQAEVGGIGVFGSIEDTSKAADMAGVKVHVISTGGVKGEVPGAPISDEVLAAAQERVNDQGELFFKSLARGRKMPIAQVRELADGRAFIAAKAEKLGLIDRISTFEDVARGLIREIQVEREARASRSRRAAAEVGLMEME